MSHPISSNPIPSHWVSFYFIQILWNSPKTDGRAIYLNPHWNRAEILIKPICNWEVTQCYLFFLQSNPKWKCSKCLPFISHKLIFQGVFVVHIDISFWNFTSWYYLEFYWYCPQSWRSRMHCRPWLASWCSLLILAPPPKEGKIGKMNCWLW